MKVMTIFFGLSLGTLIGGCCTAPGPRVSPRGGGPREVWPGQRVHRASERGPAGEGSGPAL